MKAHRKTIFAHAENASEQLIFFSWDFHDFSLEKMPFDAKITFRFLFIYTKQVNGISKQMKIAVVLNRFYPEVGGAETNLFFQVQELSKHHQVTVFTPRRLPETAKSETLKGFSVHRLLDIRNRLPNIGRDTFMPGIFFRILFGSFDVVMAWPALNHNNMLALAAAKIRRIPFVLCSFDLLDYAEIEKKTGKIDPHCLEHYTPKWLRRKLFAMCSHIFAISGREIEVFRRYNPHVSFSPVPVETSEYERDVNREEFRKRFGIASDAMVFLVLGRVSRIKGQDIAVKAFIEAAPRMPGAILAVVGRGDYEPEFLEGMKAAIRGAGLEDRVIFTGMVARNDVIGFLKSSDVMLAPVRFMNSGAVIVESWAAGTPVIQSDAVDPDLIDQGVNGWRFKSEQSGELAALLEESFKLRAQLPAMGARGREKVLSGFTYPKLISIYEETLAGL